MRQTQEHTRSLDSVLQPLIHVLRIRPKPANSALRHVLGRCLTAVHSIFSIRLRIGPSPIIAQGATRRELSLTRRSHRSSP